ncbi:hypothetical protein SAMN04487819_1414 [Actinopolyspora alba]|uniref:Uncharacterized protein n=2 Tax=Actinopolyspora alba TaxID=673379 RepID=A0A1I2CTB7_9ACTN|nr:hypothetical protein SAMN04487819_1414 [Actinopolyspora alba]
MDADEARERLEELTDIGIDTNIGESAHYEHVLLDLVQCAEKAKQQDNHKLAEQLEDFLELFGELFTDIQQLHES